MNVILKNAKILTMTEKEDFEILEGYSIYIKEGIIIDIYKDELINKYNDKNVENFNANNLLIMPGLINTHTHVGMSLFRGYKDDNSLMNWLNNVIFPKEKLLTNEDIYWCSLLSCIEMLKNGTTCFADMYFKCEYIKKAVSEVGIRAFLSWSICDDNVENIINEINIQENNNNEMINMELSLHSPYACSKNTIKKVKDYFLDKQKILQIHLAETKNEVEIIKKRYNKTPTEYLNDNGLLNSNTLLAHGIYLNDNDIEIIKENKCSISHNPISNCKLASGICDIIKLKNNGINVSIGTDGQGSTTTLDMFEELRVAAYLQKLKYEDPTIISAYDMLKMCINNGAKALKMDKMIGSIEIGKKADLIFIDLDMINLQPNNDIYSNLVYSANSFNVKHVMINGNFVMKDRMVLNVDEQEIKNKVRQIAKNIL